jgi:hypothetical protein
MEVRAALMALKMAALQVEVSLTPEVPQMPVSKNLGFGGTDFDMVGLTAWVWALALERLPAVMPRATTAAAATDFVILERGARMQTVSTVSCLH